MKQITSFILVVLVGFLTMSMTPDNEKTSLPEIAVEKMDGSKASIRDLVKGKKLTVISFWATWCKPCRLELENIAELYEDWQSDYDMQLIAVSIDDAKTKSQIKNYINGQGFDYLVVSDENSLLFKELNGKVPPMTLIINENGDILYTKHNYVDGDEYSLEDKLAEYYEKIGK